MLSIIRTFAIFVTVLFPTAIPYPCLGQSSGGFAGVQNSQDRNAEHGPSDFDRRHSLVVSALYRFPFARRSSGLVKSILSGWQTNGIVNLMSGSSFTPQLANSNFSLGEARRPDRIGSGKLANPSLQTWFNLADFKPVPTGWFRFGNSGRISSGGLDRSTSPSRCSSTST